MNLRNYHTVKDRREVIEEKLHVSLTNVGSFSLDEGVASTRNCENMIGATQVPLGIAGPLKVSRVNVSGIKEYYIPLATTEGALVASVNRGCKAITESGGATVDSDRVGATRGPVFKTSGIQASLKLRQWINDHFNNIYHLSEKTSTHISLLKVDTEIVANLVYFRFIFDTQDAMGMNMATIATQKIAEHIEKETGVTCLSLAGNFDIDKKPAWLNFIENRGYKAWAEVVVPSQVLVGTLKTSARKIYDVWLAKCMIGSAISGSMGFNAQFANIIAALFLATGQDLGHIGEGSMGITTTEVDGEDLYMSVTLPDLMVGTVGGGTGLATQQEALTLLGVAGGSPAGEDGNNAQTFAEIIGGAVLAGELSLLASLSEGTLAKAHQTLARGIKSDQFTNKYQSDQSMKE